MGRLIGIGRSSSDYEKVGLYYSQKKGVILLPKDVREKLKIEEGAALRVSVEFE